jgi:hypothetical protein
MRYRVCGVFAGVFAAAAWGQCEPGWSEVFTPAFFTGGNQATATVFDDGSGPKLVIAGVRRAGDPDPGLQVWDGQSWSALDLPPDANGSNGIVRAFNDHAPAQLVFADLGATDNLLDIYIYEEGQWRATGFPDSNEFISWPTAIIPAEDPSGDGLYMSGLFRNSSQDYSLVYKWDGMNWTSIAYDSGGSSASVTTLAWYDDGSGTRLFAGLRDEIDDQQVLGVAKWTGESWVEVGGGCPAYWPTIAVHDDGNGPALWALDSGGLLLAKWDGASWASYPLDGAAEGIAWRLTSVELAGQQELVWIEGLGDSTRLWRWDGAQGQMIAETTVGRVWDIATSEDPDLGAGIFAVGDFLRAGELPVSSAARWGGSAWHALGNTDVGNGVDFASDMLALGDDTGALAGRVYVAAGVAAGQETHGVAAWDGEQWHPIGPAEMSSTTVYALGLGDLGDGPRLFAAGGIVPQAGETKAIIAWDGQDWSVAGQGIEDGAVEALAFGTIAGGEPTLYAAGWFTQVDGQDNYGVVGLTASGWTGLAGGLPDAFDHSEVKAIAFHDDGSGAALYADTPSRPANTDFTNCVVRWDGQSWTRVGASLSNGSSNVRVYALLSADLGAGALLYAAGDFDGPNDSLQNIAAWDGAAWQPLGAGLPAAVNALARLDTPDGPRLAAACTAPAGGVEPEMVWLWDGVAWSPFGAEASGSVGAITQASFDRDAVYLGGGFNEVAGIPSQGIARYGCPPCPADFNDDGTLDTRDFIAFLAAWAAGDGSADFNGDGAINTQDFIAYLNAWAAGC